MTGPWEPGPWETGPPDPNLAPYAPPTGAGPHTGPPQSPWGTPTYGQPPYGYGPPPGGQPPGQVASMGSRLGARIIDAILIGIVVGVLGIAFHLNAFHSTHTVTSSDGTTTVTSYHFGATLYPAFGISAAIGLFYEVGMIAKYGATLGKMAVGIKVVLGTTGGAPGLGPSFIRWVIPTAAGFFCILELVVYLSPFFDGTGRRQGWHDKAANTFVVRAR